MLHQATSLFWLIVGFTGQAMFTARFLIQWIKSEKEGRSVIPLAFWYFSLAGSFTLLIYACHRADPVFIVGQSTGSFIYLRNLYLIQKERAKQASENSKVLNSSAGPLNNAS